MIDKDLHWAMVKYLSARADLSSGCDVRKFAEDLISSFLTEKRLLGVGREGLVFKDGGTVKKFILIWDDPRRNIALVHERLLRLGALCRRAKHLYGFEASRIAENVLLVSYPFEESIDLTKKYLREHWRFDLRHQYFTFQSEFVETGFFSTNLKAANFVLVNGVLKFIDYGRDCVPVLEAMLSLRRMWFMKTNGIYDLGE